MIYRDRARILVANSHEIFRDREFSSMSALSHNIFVNIALVRSFRHYVFVTVNVTVTVTVTVTVGDKLRHRWILCVVSSRNIYGFMGL